MVSNAIFNKEGDHRYALIRIWNPDKPKVSFIGFNPSKANEVENDNTIEKVIKIARYNGFGGLYMLNLFSFVTSKPKQVIFCQASQEINDQHILKYTKLSENTVLCWGNLGGDKTYDRKLNVASMFQDSYCLHVNKNGSPKHPLYCLDKTQIIKYR